MIEVDATDFLKLADEMERSAAKLIAGLVPGMERGAVNIKKGMRDEIAGSAWFYRAASDVTYDRRRSVSSLEYEIGPSSDGGRPGDLAALAYFGGSNGGGGTLPDPSGHLDREEPALVENIARVLEGVL